MKVMPVMLSEAKHLQTCATEPGKIAMSQEHEKMVKDLKEIVVTRLRNRGFKGSFPHFRSPNKVTVLHIHPEERVGLQPGNVDSSPSDWFRYDRPIRSVDIYEKTAKDVLPYIEKAEVWWKR